MPKRVKTKKQKMLADLRRINSAPKIEKADFTTYSLPIIKGLDKKTPTPAYTPKASGRSINASVSTIGYTYLLKDLRKTILLTCSIIVVELLIRFYFKI